MIPTIRRRADNYPGRERGGWGDGEATCNQVGCGKPAAFLFTWPGDVQKGICQEHSERLKGVASAMGMFIQLIPIPADPNPLSSSVVHGTDV